MKATLQWTFVLSVYALVAWFTLLVVQEGLVEGVLGWAIGAVVGSVRSAPGIWARLRGALAGSALGMLGGLAFGAITHGW